MKRRIIAAVAAVLSAAVGASLLLSYVAGADRRAMAGMQTVTVLVVAKDIAKGAPADALSAQVTNKVLPVTAVAPGTVSSLAELRGLVATADLKVGEQVLASRFTDPATLAKADQPQVPNGMHEVTIKLDAQRVVGGEIAPGARVGVFVSVDKQTALVLSSVLVTRVTGGTQPAAAEGEQAEAAAPSETVQVTLATTPPNIEKVVFGMENGSVWLSLVSPGSTTTGTRIVNGKNVYK